VAIVNQCNFLVDFSGYKDFRQINVDGKLTELASFKGYTPEAEGTKPARGLVFVAYGYKAEMAYAFIEKGTRAFVFSHVQTRAEHDRLRFEFVIDNIQYIKNENEEEGERKRRELVERGVLLPNRKDLGLDGESGNE